MNRALVILLKASIGFVAAFTITKLLSIRKLNQEALELDMLRRLQASQNYANNKYLAHVIKPKED